MAHAMGYFLSPLRGFHVDFIVAGNRE